MNIIEWDHLGNLYYSGNIPDIKLFTGSDFPFIIAIKLERNGLDDIEIEEKYYSESGSIIIQAKDLIQGWLNSNIDNLGETTPIGGDYISQTEAAGTVTITATEDSPDPTGEAKSFTVIKGAIDAPIDYDFASFFNERLLTLGPTRRRVKLNEPVLLNHFTESDYAVHLSVTTAAPVVNYYSVNGIEAPFLHTIDATFSKLREKFSEPFNKAVQIYLSINSNWENSILLQLINDYDQFEDYFAFETSIGGMDTIRFNGVLSEIPEHEYLSAIKRGITLEYKTTPKTIYRKNTGFVGNSEHSRWVMDFFASSKRYHYYNGRWRRIYITEVEAESIKNRINSFLFTFSYADPNIGRVVQHQEL